MDVLLVEGLRPFSILAGFILLLLIVELALMMVGLSSSIEVEGAGDGFDADVDADTGLFSGVTDGGILTPDDLALIDLPQDQPRRLIAPRPSPMRRFLALCGIGKGPLLVSLTCLAAGISACGYLLQLTVQGVSGSMLAPGLAVALALVPGVLLGGRLAALVARLIPSFESHAISAQTYNGRRGHVVIGDARRGDPAQVRWRDMYGTTHSLMAEPLRAEEVIPAGTEVLIVKTRDRQPRIVSVSAS